MAQPKELKCPDCGHSGAIVVQKHGIAVCRWCEEVYTVEEGGASVDEQEQKLRIDGVYGPLPDGSGFATASLPLPKDHWSYGEAPLNPPAPLRMGVSPLRSKLAEAITEAGKYAYLSAQCGDPDHDPDALLQNLVVGLLGVWTEDGYSHDRHVGDCRCGSVGRCGGGDGNED